MVENSINKKSKKSNYDDISSFLEEDLDIEEENEEVPKKVEIKKSSTSAEDLAAKKARIIEGTNFDNSLRKSKKKKKKKIKKI